MGYVCGPAQFKRYTQRLWPSYHLWKLIQINKISCIPCLQPTILYAFYVCFKKPVYCHVFLANWMTRMSFPLNTQLLINPILTYKSSCLNLRSMTTDTIDDVLQHCCRSFTLSHNPVFKNFPNHLVPTVSRHICPHTSVYVHMDGSQGWLGATKTNYASRFLC